MIKKNFFAIIGVALLPTAASARELDANEALEAAMQRLSASHSQSYRAKATKTPRSAIRLSFTRKSADDKSLFYVYDLSDGGYIIAAADDRARALLGYADEGSYVESLENPAFREWTEQCTEAMEWLSRQPEMPSKMLRQSLAKEQKKDAGKLTPVSPLLGNIKWSQNYPFNAMCPYRPESNGALVHAPTGCVATATAQIMMFHKWPETGVGSHTSDADTTQTVDFSQSTYDWAHIYDTYTGKETEEEIMPVAKLLYDIGCAENMGYDASGSGTPSNQALYALATYFRYDRGIRRIERTCYTSEAWNEALRNELNEKRPILFSASSTRGGHSFVIDGYDENGLYHVNWGWNGQCNGHFDMDYLDSDMQRPGSNVSCFNIEQAAIVNIKKDETGSSVASPHLRILYGLEYDSSNKGLTYVFINEGMGDFTGKAGFLFADSAGNVKQKYLQSYSSNPVSYNGAKSVRLKIPEEMRGIVGLKVHPFYVIDGEEKLFECPLIKCNCLVSYNNSEGEIGWKTIAEDAPMLKIDEYMVLRNYVGTAPKIQLTITNNKCSKVEYNDVIKVYIATDTDVLCHGSTQLFLLPGETKTITVDCVRKRNAAPDKLEAGSYYFVPQYMSDKGAMYFDDSTGQKNFEYETFTLTETEPLNIISYKNITLDKTEIEQEQQLTVTFDVVNDGGFGKKNYVAYIYDANGDKHGYLQNDDAGIEPHATTTVSVSGMISNLAPGTYHLRVRDYSHEGYILNEYPQFIVKENTSSDIVSVSEKTNSMSAMIHDLSGRRLTNPSKRGLYIVGGRKIIR